MVENDESMDAPKTILSHWKYNNYEKDTKSSNPWTLQNVSTDKTKLSLIGRLGKGIFLNCGLGFYKGDTKSSSD